MRRRRDAGLEAYWRRVLAQWQSSGQNIRAFCAQRQLSQPSFYAWKRELAKRDVERSSVPTFVPVQVMPDAIIEVVLPAGVIVRVPVGLDVAAVARLVAALGSASC